jgi:hypothetical protein
LASAIARTIGAVRDLASGVQLACEPIRRADADTTIALLSRLFAEHGPPLVLKSDNGKALTQGDILALCQLDGGSGNWGAEENRPFAPDRSTTGKQSGASTGQHSRQMPRSTLYGKAASLKSRWSARSTGRSSVTSCLAGFPSLRKLFFVQST